MKKNLFLSNIILLLLFFTCSMQAQVVTTFAGNYEGYYDATGTAAQFNYPTGIAIDAAGNLYVIDANNEKIRKITPAGVVSTFAGSSMGSADGTGTAAQFNAPYGITIDATGNLYVTDTWNSIIRKITTAGVVTTIAGSTPGFADGTGAAAQFDGPSGITIDAVGNLYVADKNNNRIRKITPAGVVTTFAGGTSGFVDGTGTAAKFTIPFGITIDATGNLYVADSFNNRIRKITQEGVVTTVAGSAISGNLDGTGITAQFYHPCGITVDSTGNLYVVDTWNSIIRKITPAAVVTTVSVAPFSFNYPNGIAIDATGDLYIADTNNFKIKKIGLILGTNNFKVVSDFSIYPNPSRGIVNIKSSFDGDFVIVNQLGQKIKSFKVKSDSLNTINIGNLSTGIYFVKSVDGTNSSSQKLIVQ